LVSANGLAANISHARVIALKKRGSYINGGRAASVDAADRRACRERSVQPAFHAVQKT
jgi:hypothetical protein